VVFRYTVSARGAGGGRKQCGRGERELGGCRSGCGFEVCGTGVGWKFVSPGWVTG